MEQRDTILIAVPTSLFRALLETISGGQRYLALGLWEPTNGDGQSAPLRLVVGTKSADGVEAEANGFVHITAGESNGVCLSANGETPDGSPQAASLSARDREVLALLARGASNRQIATTLCVSANTAKSHVRRIMAKLKVCNRTQAAIIGAKILQGSVSYNQPQAGSVELSWERRWPTEFTRKEASRPLPERVR